ncbi:MAG: DUF4358 domain-containing protein [Candidatus Merdivicinus sp.]
MKWLNFLAGTVSACLLLASCGGSEEAQNVDIEALAQELNTGINYEDPLEKLDSDMIGMLYAVDGMVTESVVYMGSGATAEEIAVFACNDTDTAKNEVKPVVEAHVQSQIDAFEDYVPGEVAKLEKAVIRQSGKYVALSVSNDPDSANKILDNYMK